MTQDILKQFLDERGLFYGWKIFLPAFQKPQQQEEQPILLNLDFGSIYESVEKQQNKNICINTTNNIENHCCLNLFPSYHYYCVDTHVLNLLKMDNIGFIMQPVRRGLSDLVQFQPPGKFSALLIQSSYRQLGINGKKVLEDLFLVTLNIKEGKNVGRNLERLQEGLSRQNFSNKFMVVQANQDGSCAEIDFKPEIKSVRNPCRFSSWKLSGITMCIPDLPEIENQTWISKYSLQQLHNYFGNLALCNEDCNYVNELKWCKTNKNFNSVEILFWQGLFLPIQIHVAILKLSSIVDEKSLPWIAITAYGFQNGLVKLHSGDDLFTIVLLGKGQYIRFSSGSDGRGNENVKFVKGELLL